MNLKEERMFKIWAVAEIISWIIVLGVTKGLYSKNIEEEKGGN